MPATHVVKGMVGKRHRFAFADTLQQVVGGILLSGPFVVTGEVWELARHMTVYHAVAEVAIVLVIGYAALYKAESQRDPEEEPEVAGIPVRYLSLIAVSYLSVLLLVYLFAAARTFEAGPVTTAKVITTGAIFSMVGAATADSLF